MSYIDISTAVVRETCTFSVTGSSTVRHDPPWRVFWLEYVEDDCRSIVWDGATYLDALAAANDWVDDDVEVRDRVAATWGRA